MPDLPATLTVGVPLAGPAERYGPATMSPPSGSRWPTAAATVLPRALTALRRNPPPERPALLALMVVSVLLVLAGSTVSLQAFPPGVQVIPLLGGGLLLGRPRMRLLVLVVALGAVTQIVQFGAEQFRTGALVALGVAGLVGYEFCRAREETGMAGSAGETFVLELRDRLVLQGTLPALPARFGGESVLRPAGGGPFAGDFVVSALTEGSTRLELALVDVSGKGVDAGTRALLLSGALGGLLGSVDPALFLAAANRYLVRQDWEEGFATAAHLVLDLTDGSFAVDSAGHPPVAKFDAGSGRWSLLDAEGVALGLLAEADYVPDTGRLDVGDALLLYTDGLVEVPGRDLSVGIDRLLGEAERLVPRGFEGGAELLAARVAGDGQDDRGLVLLWRRS